MTKSEHFADDENRADRHPERSDGMRQERHESSQARDGGAGTVVRHPDGHWEVRAPDPAREDSGNPASDREDLQDLPPADAEDEDDQDEAEIQQTPAGRSGADSGSADTVAIDPETTTRPGGVSPDRNEFNDEPGVGPRGMENEEDHEGEGRG